MRADHRADAVLERGHDSTAVGVVLRVGREDHAEIEVESNRIASDLDVPLFQHIEQTDLDLGGEIGQLVDGENSAVRARDQAEVHGQLARKVSTLGVLDHIDFANQVGDRHVGSGELLVVSPISADPLDRGPIALLGDELTSLLRDGRQRMIVDLGAGDDRNRFIEEMDQLTEHPGLGLTAQTQEQDIMLGQDRVLDLRDNGLLVAEDVGKQAACLSSSLAMRFRLISSLTDSIRYPLDFSSPKVRGRSVIATLLRLNVESIREQPIKKTNHHTRHAGRGSQRDGSGRRYPNPCWERDYRRGD